MKNVINLGLHSAETIARRVPVIASAWASPASADHAELVRMVVEKQAALASAIVGVQVEMWKALVSPWWLRSSSGQRKAGLAMMNAALAPAARKARANAVRLRRKARSSAG